MEYYGTAHCMAQRLDPADRTSISMSVKHVKARIVDATQGSVVFALDDINSSKTVEYAMSYADACRFSGRLLNQADYHSRHTTAGTVAGYGPGFFDGDDELSGR
jgi:hypothetical protein